MDYDNVLKERRCTRVFSTKKVSFDKIIEICESARMAPMAGNIYTLKLVLVSEKAKKQELAEAALGQEFIADANHVLVVCSDTSELKRSYGSRAEIYARQQAGAAIENMFLKAVDLGLGTCWIGAFDENAVKRIINAPDTVQIEAMLPVSYAASPGKEAKKKPDLKMILHFEKWGQKVMKKPKEAVP